jgi:hypothetical protein
MLQCCLCVLYILHRLSYEKGGHKASTYRQIEQYPDPTYRIEDGAIAPEGFVLLAIVDPFINKRINYQYNDRLMTINYRDLVIEAEVS